MDQFFNFLRKAYKLLDQYGSPFVLLWIRIHMGLVFYKSGLNSTKGIDSALFLEFTCALLLFVGLATRLAAIPLLFITAAIEFTYKPLPVHDFWAICLLVLLVKGPGKLSLDFLLKNHWNKKYPEN